MGSRKYRDIISETVHECTPFWGLMRFSRGSGEMTRTKYRFQIPDPFIRLFSQNTSLSRSFKKNKVNSFIMKQIFLERKALYSPVSVLRR